MDISFPNETNSICASDITNQLRSMNTLNCTVFCCVQCLASINLFASFQLIEAILEERPPSVAGESASETPENCFAVTAMVSMECSTRSVAIPNVMLLFHSLSHGCTKLGPALRYLSDTLGDRATKKAMARAELIAVSVRKRRAKSKQK